MCILTSGQVRRFVDASLYSTVTYLVRFNAEKLQNPSYKMICFHRLHVLRKIDKPIVGSNKQEEKERQMDIVYNRYELNYIYIYIYCYPQTDCFVVSQLFSVAVFWLFSIML